MALLDSQAEKEAPDEAEMRCLEANQILVLAKHVITAELASDKKPGVTDSEQLQDLCLMILGETLSSTLIHIMERCNISLPGWQIENGGWGPPKFVFTKMREAKWCERFQEVLKNQLGQNATLLYTTLSKLNGEPSHSNHSCTRDRCVYVEARHTTSNSPDAEYKPQHHRKCNQHGITSVDQAIDCQLVGIDEGRLIKMVNECTTGDLSVELVKWSSTGHAPYVTISHVWAHGLGNKSGPKIWRCQLQYIHRLLKQVPASLNPPEEIQTSSNISAGKKCRYFWLDTLAIPVNDSAARQKAIKDIFYVFDNATCGIVVDKYVTQDGVHENPRTLGIRLLSSAWMQRLWTLQEAFVSRKLSIALNEDKLKGIDDLLASENERGIFIDSSAMVARKLSQNLMGDERVIRNQSMRYANGEPDHARSSSLIASAWHSARFRSVGRLENETQVLASLLNVQPPVLGNETEKGHPKGDPRWLMFRERLMAQFWTGVASNETLKHSIPAGIIFLPGKRLNIKGFGWAPATSMPGQDEDYPYPLSTLGEGTELSPIDAPKGLFVTYPGYRIRALRRKSGRVIHGPFHFSVNMGLYDWYLAEPINKGNEDSDARFALQEINNGAAPNLAVIVSRPRPVETPAEIALLVSIYDHVPTGDSGDSGHHQSHQRPHETQDPVIYCRIIRRLKISRVSDPRSLSIPDEYNVSGASPAKYNGSDAANDRMLRLYQKFDPGIVGIATSERQRWCVDGYVVSDAEIIPGTAGCVPKLPTETFALGSGSQLPSQLGSVSGDQKDQPVRAATEYSQIRQFGMPQADRAETLPVLPSTDHTEAAMPGTSKSKSNWKKFTNNVVPKIARPWLKAKGNAGK
ncbi:uncharacterized protein PG998_003187 [Apiospora kogelbergensis]|uniref:uncharacterized protein n=1 Tax=Apiospora kogelbergensis TaxID=1337665 RepID=UPI00312F7742